MITAFAIAIVCLVCILCTPREPTITRFKKTQRKVGGKVQTIIAVEAEDDEK